MNGLDEVPQVVPVRLYEGTPLQVACDWLPGGRPASYATLTCVCAFSPPQQEGEPGMVLWHPVPQRRGGGPLVPLYTDTRSSWFPAAGELMRIPVDEGAATWATLRLVAYVSPTHCVFPPSAVEAGTAASTGLWPLLFDPRDWN